MLDYMACCPFLLPVSWPLHIQKRQRQPPDTSATNEATVADTIQATILFPAYEMYNSIYPGKVTSRNCSHQNMQTSGNVVIKKQPHTSIGFLRSSQLDVEVISIVVTV